MWHLNRRLSVATRHLLDQQPEQGLEVLLIRTNHYQVNHKVSSRNGRQTLNRLKNYGLTLVFLARHQKQQDRPLKTRKTRAQIPGTLPYPSMLEDFPLVAPMVNQ
jgi:hypothetical protein